MYSQYTKNYWIDRGILSGFAEWPNGVSGPQDIDSGPIVMGIGLGATGLGIGAAIAQGDADRLKRITSQLSAIELLRPFLVTTEDILTATSEKHSMNILNNEYFTGFLFGDAMLFYCVTWTSWDPRMKSKTNLCINNS